MKKLGKESFNPLISVIVIGYKRKTYIKEAINSVLTQSLDKKRYEIIVVKSFKDKKLDSYIARNNIKNIYLNPKYAVNFGTTIYEGIKQAKGRVLCFLDDDDLFIRNKLDRVYNAFVGTPELVYYRNNIIGIDKFGRKIDFSYGNTLKKFVINNQESKVNDYYKFILLNYYFNSSSVCIKKDIIMKHIRYLKMMRRSPDDFFAYIALISKGYILCDNAFLSKYRMHPENTTAYATDINYNKTNKSLHVIENLIKKYGGKDTLKVLVAKEKRFKLDHAIIVCRNLSLREVIGYLFTYSLPFLIYCHKLDRFSFLTMFALIFRKRSQKILYGIEIKIRE